MINRIKGWFLLNFYISGFLKRFRSRRAKVMFFLRQYEATQKKIWGMEFVVEGLREGREGLRREYDKLNETLDASKIAYEKAQGEEKEKLNLIIETKLKEIEEWKKKIDMADETILGTQDQVDGLYDQLPKLEKIIKE